MMAWQSALIIINKKPYLKLDSPASTPFTNSNEWNYSPAKQLAGKAISSFAAQMNPSY
ncbi:hypothetical protein ACRN9O_06870 [Shewanella oncorhynchi]|uniref:hypothetical protein n=1 Tax=Shewanella TaxID=22 RepID=UPI0021DA2C62|nr:MULTISPECIES: hypothetical protein [unclassified Shewanella]MCU8055759.1 hypothetical protein [Shewanella sp. SM35]MCU8064818.1 hypothetical protein [Shewanella sp. SM34]MCU8076880.1 hypothetical protein [Shewanella sp. SM29]